MTLLDDRLQTTPDSAGASMVKVRSSSTASFKFAARLARREVRRRPGRTLLVMLLIAVPVIGMALGSIVMRTNHADGSGEFARQNGTADLRLSTQEFPIDLTGPAPLGTDQLALPQGSSLTSYATAHTVVRADVDGVITSTYVQLTDVDLTNPIVTDTVEVREGRTPTTAGEVLLSSDVAKRFAVSVGDTLTLVRPDVRLDVVGIGRDVAYFGTSLMVAPGFDRELFDPSRGAVQGETLVDLPDTLSDAQIEAIAVGLDQAGVPGQPQFYVERSYGNELAYQTDDTSKALAWGWVAGAVAFMAVGIIIAAAFATSARRQLVTIGQLSSNGASERLVRRTMGLQGMWTGVLGASLGLVVAVVGSLIAYRAGLYQSLTSHTLDTLRINPLDMSVVFVTAVVAALIAALIPARSAARIPVLSALAGRRPVATPPKWMAPAGIALFLGGLFLLAGAAGTPNGGDFAAMLAVIGSLGVMFGIVCASPLIVSQVGRIGSKAGGVVRLASRSLDRSRARSAAVLTAIAVVGALAVAGATAAGTAENSADNGGWVPDLKRVTVSFQSDGNQPVEEQPATDVWDDPPVIPTALPIDIRQGLEHVLPDATWMPVTQVIDDPLPYRPSTGEQILPPGADPSLMVLSGLVVADDLVVKDLDLSDEQQQILDETGIITTTPWHDDAAQLETPDGFIDIDLGASRKALGFTGPIVTEADQQRANELNNTEGRLSGIVVSPAFVAEHSLATGVNFFVIDNPVDLTSEQRDAINDLQPYYSGNDAFTVEASAPGYEDLGNVDGSSWWSSVDYPNSVVPWALIQAGVALASLLMVLMVVAIGLSLAATESRDERDVLHAVGAAPSTLRRVAAAKAWVLATGAGVVAVPAGYITVFVITRATDSTAPVPFAVIGALLVAIPLLAAGATLLTSSIAQRVKPVTYSTFGND